MKVTVSKIHGKLDLVFLDKGKVIGTTTISGKTESPYTRTVPVAGEPDEVVLDVEVVQHGFTLDQIQLGFENWKKYYQDGGECSVDDPEETAEQYAQKATEALIHFIKGE